jgi:phosphoribosylformimino-5-aminoimidazole carboxamide ribotide isomerase
MIIYPDIGIQDGRCVTLRNGQMTQPEIYAHDPIAKALEFVEQGAECLDVVDLDAVRRCGRGAYNRDMIVSLINALPVPVQVGGGIRRLDQVAWWMEHGADCVVIGSAACLKPSMVRKACERYPFRIMLAVDVCQGRVKVNGWTRCAELTPLEFASRFDRLDLGGIIVTDIDYDIDLPDASFALVTGMARHLTTPVIVSGVVKTLDHLSTLKYFDLLAGAVVGRALHNGTFTLSEALHLIWEVESSEGYWRERLSDIIFPVG